MHHTLTKLLLRESPHRVDAHLPTAEYHATLTPVAEEAEGPNANSHVANLFKENGAESAPPSEVNTPNPPSSETKDTEASASSPSEPIAVTAAAAAVTLAKKHAQPMASPDVRTLLNFKIGEARFQEGYDTDGKAPPVYNMKAGEFEEEVEKAATNEAFVPSEPQLISILAADIAKQAIPKQKHDLMIHAVHSLAI